MTTISSAHALLTIEDVADLLRVSTKSVRRWIATRELPVHRIGRQLRMTIDDLNAYLCARREGSPLRAIIVSQSLSRGGAS